MKARHFIVVCLMGMILLPSISCKKAIEEQYDDILKKLMTDGSWTITSFTEGGADITASFGGWICKFHDNNTMTATQGTAPGAIVHTGAWQSNITAQNITAQFPASVGEPLSKINGTWGITSSSPTVGRFAQTKGSISYTMELTKY